MGGPLGNLQQPVGSIAYIGGLTAEQDDSFRKFQTALSQHWGHPLDGASLQYIAVNIDDMASIGGGIALAKARGARLLVVPTGEAAMVARVHADQTPFVFATFQEPDKVGLRRGDDGLPLPCTGVGLADHLDDKRIELLKEAYPHVQRLAVLADKSWVDEYGEKTLVFARERFALTVQLLTVETVEELEVLMQSAEVAAFDAWFVPPTYIAYIAEARIIAHLKRLNQPAIHATVAEVKAGALMAYEQDNAFAHAAMADLVHRILNGEDAASIPVERPRRIVLAVRADAQVGGQRINPAVVRKADLVF